jgi:hypothetical protein
MAEPAVETEPDDDAEAYGFGDPIGWFRDEPARIFAVLATFLFVLGWVGVIYLSVFSGSYGGQVGPSDTAVRVQLAISLGATVTLATAALWIVAALLWRRR